MERVSSEIYAHLAGVPPSHFLSSFPISFSFCSATKFHKEGFIENPCLGIYSGLCHELWQHRTSLLLYNSKYLNKAITMKSTALFSGSWTWAHAGACPDRSERDSLQRLPLMGRLRCLFEGKAVFFPKTILCGTRIVFLKPRSASMGHGSDST